MSLLSPALRKAAVLISTLDDETAEAVLRQMSTDDAAKVRSALVALQGISSDEQQQVLAEFLRQQGAPALTPIGDEGVALELDPAVEAAASNDLPASNPAPLPPPRQEERPFAFLEAVAPKAIADLLAREHPQTAAVVIAHLPPQHAAAVLEQLPAALATEALERIAWLNELTPEIQADLSRELQRQLAPHLHAASAPPASLAHLAAVIDAMDFRQRHRVVLQLGDRNTALLNRLGLYPNADAPSATGDAVTALRYRLDSEADAVSRAPWTSPEAKPEEPWLTFDDLALLDDADLRAVFAAADIEIALLALTGAEPRLLSRILRKLPAGQAGALRRRLEHPGPVRLRDIEQARSALATVASRLAHEGTIALPPTSRFAAAA
jgi:flagellar motor switch protein FliG